MLVSQPYIFNVKSSFPQIQLFQGTPTRYPGTPGPQNNAIVAFDCVGVCRLGWNWVYGDRSGSLTAHPAPIPPQPHTLTRSASPSVWSRPSPGRSTDQRPSCRHRGARGKPATYPPRRQDKRAKYRYLWPRESKKRRELAGNLRGGREKRRIHRNQYQT